MIRIIKPRGSGKTTDIIKESYKLNVPIVVSDQYRKKFVKDLANQLGIKILEPITIYDIKNGNTRGLSSTNKGVLIDDIDHVMQSFLFEYTLSIAGFTVSSD